MVLQPSAGQNVSRQTHPVHLPVIVPVAVGICAVLAGLLSCLETRAEELQAGKGSAHAGYDEEHS